MHSDAEIGARVKFQPEDQPRQWHLGTFGNNLQELPLAIGPVLPLQFFANMLQLATRHPSTQFDVSATLLQCICPHSAGIWLQAGSACFAIRAYLQHQCWLWRQCCQHYSVLLHLTIMCYQPVAE